MGFNQPLRALFQGLLAVALLQGCASQPAPLAFHPKDTIRTSQLRWQGARNGVAWLKRHYRVTVDVKVDPESAMSRIEYHGLRARFGPATGPEVVTIVTPANAVPTGTHARIFKHQEAFRPTQVIEVRQTAGGADPDQKTWHVSFPQLKIGEVLEFVMAFRSQGTLVNDARFVGAPDAQTAELLVSYFVPESAISSLKVIGMKREPVTASKEGYRVMGLLLNDVPARKSAAAPYIRYITRYASPKNYDQAYATTWPLVLKGYEREFGQRTKQLRDNAQAPFKEKRTSIDGVKAVFRWVRGRIQRADAMNAHWKSGAKLPTNMTRNNLSAVDKVHLLHWLLDASGIKHEIAMARSGRYPKINPAIPAPGLFDVPIVYVSGFRMWLDPACQQCEPGEVRSALKGSQAVIVSGTQGVGTVLSIPR